MVQNTLGSPMHVLETLTPDPMTPDPEVDELDEEFEDDDDDDPNVFKVHDALDPASAQQMTTRELHDLVHDGHIDINPPYQRGVVWPEAKQIGLIDSIFRNFYIPPLVFAWTKDEEGEEIRVCVDGKQRLTSIQRFIDGEIPHKDHKTKKSFWFTCPEGPRAQIPEKDKKMFEEKELTCVEYSKLSSGTERELFQRVQLGMCLTAAEKLQAISSPWAEWISELEARHVTVEGGLAEVLEWDTRRSRDFQNIAHMVYCCHGLPQQLLPTAQKIEKWISQEDQPSHQFKQEIEEVLKSFWRVATNGRYNDGFVRVGRRLAPVEFIFVGVLLYKLRNQPLEVRGKAIYYLREAIREEHRDIRNNGTVGKAMWKYIDLLASRPTVAPVNIQTVVKKTSKRKKDDDTDDGEEYRPGAGRSAGKATKTRKS